MLSTPLLRQWRISRPVIVLIVLIILMAVIFIADTFTDYAVAAAVLHTTVLLIATRFLSARTVILMTAACVFLTILSFLLTRSGAYQVGLINTSISVVVIGVTAYLGLRLKSAEQSAHDARERLLRMARLTTLGQLTTSIAHEVSQPLAAIATSAGACNRWLGQNPPNVDKAIAAAERVINEANRASSILTRVRGMARSEAPRRAPFAFNQAVQEVLELSRGDLIRLNVEVTLALADDLPDAFADRVQIQQVIGNLLLNAIDASSDGGAGTPRLRITTSQREPGRLMFSIRDNGPGIAADAAQHLFDAFWTTKQGGFGLGLTISRSIVEANGGHIWAASLSQEQGADFQFDVRTMEAHHD